MSDQFSRVSALLFEEAAALDEQRWDDWLTLFTPDIEYWMPAWDSEHEMTQDPTSEISLMYYSDRSGLEDRIWRIKSGMSSASTPLPRTCHLVTNIRVGAVTDGLLQVKANWQGNAYRHEKTDSFYGRYEYGLREEQGNLLIARKKIVLMNDVIPSVVDIYNV
ncbi:MAG: aromatic-ring-hydroxylating dioxygenase subunit beta [Immundisolibacter sp.]|uniref:aromatic-ring-hydroxylating dioxygenase subunit beta n=1 Tax=Immundisolibacter sp. TaxID=1934948 RepID=UPI003D0C3014